MSDTKLRDLERRWKETGAVEDEAAYLLERVRVGDLPQPAAPALVPEVETDASRERAGSVDV